MLNSIKRILGFNLNQFDMVYEEFKSEGFSLRQDSQNESEATGDGLKESADKKSAEKNDESGERANTEKGEEEKQKKQDGNEPAPAKSDANSIEMKKPVKVKDWKEHQQKNDAQKQQEKGDKEEAGDEVNKSSRTYLDKELARNRSYIEKTFGLPTNADIIIRDFTIATNPEIKALVVYLEGLSDKTVINDTILKSLMQLTAMHDVSGNGERSEIVKETLLPGNQVMSYEKWDDVIKNILMGSSAVLIDGSSKALVIETKGWQQRSVGEPQAEKVIRGPHDAFTENLRTNTALIRLRLQTNGLITEMMQVGQRSNTTIAMMYIKGIANPALIKEVKRRIKALDTDIILDSGMIEQMIEDKPGCFVPSVLSTERPDRASAFLSEGHVVLIINNSPYALIAPVSLWGLLHTAEDVYLRWPLASFLRILRLVSMILAMLMPGVYIAVTNYHAEMIPTELMMAIASSRENVPFPVVAEVLLMEFAIELIREAGVRIPSVIGPTIGIVGALILGQAAVTAGIVSPLLVIVVAVTALASFTVPNYNLSFGVRIVRFYYLVAGAIYGFFGLSLLIVIMVTYLAGIKSFGVPLLAPISPYSRSHDAITRSKLFEVEERPTYMQPLDHRKQDPLQRKWNLKAKFIVDNQKSKNNDQTNQKDRERGNRDDS